MILIKITGHSILDPVIAILVAVIIFKTGYSISQRAGGNLLDHSLPEDNIKKIKDILNAHADLVKLKENSIKARQIGPSKDIDLILQFPNNTTICECHKICDDIEQHIQTLYPNCNISIHSEPDCYRKNCKINCNKDCSNKLE